MAVTVAWLKATAKALKGIPPKELLQTPFIRSFDTDSMTIYGQNAFFYSTHSFDRGFRFNFSQTWPVFYLAGDQLTASFEIGARTRDELLGPLLSSEKNPYLYVYVRVSALVLDLTSKKIRESLGIGLNDLLIPTKKWDDDMKNGIWAITHHLGALTLNDGRFGGILYPYISCTRTRKDGKKKMFSCVYG